MSDPKEDGNQEELEWLLFELDEAREDQRVSLDHIVGTVKILSQIDRGGLGPALL